MDCSFCGKTSRYKCSRCNVPYCSKTCQLNDWPEHLKICKITKEYIAFANKEQNDLFEKFELAKGEKLNSKGTVFKVGTRVFKLCKTELEFLSTYIFLKQYQSLGIVPHLLMTDDSAWVIVSEYADGYTTLQKIERQNIKIDKDVLQQALIVALSKFKSPSFGRDLYANFSNIAFNGESVIFYENNGKLFKYDDLETMILNFLSLMRNERNGKRLIGKIYSIGRIRQLMVPKRVYDKDDTETDE